MNMLLQSPIRYLLVPIFLLAFGSSAYFQIASAQSRQLQQTPVITEWPNKAKRWALVIGVDSYGDDQITKLNGAANDARTLANALVRYAGFPQDQVTLLATGQDLQLQPRRATILRYLSNMRRLVPKDGLLLVAFAGHGIEREGRAYLLHVDAEGVNDIGLLEDTAIGVERVKELIRATGVGQVVLILDPCRSDPVAGHGNDNNLMPSNFSRSLNFDLKNREVNAFATLYATAVGERAFEYQQKKQGYFTWALIEGLKGKAANSRGEVTLANLVKFVQETVPKLVQRDLGADKKQQPFAVIEGYRADDLVLSVTSASQASASESPSENMTAQSVDPKAIELSYWETIKNSNDPEDFRAYLRKYPNGEFADLAKRRAGLAKQSQTNSNTPQETQSALTFKACNFILGKDIYEKWVQLGGESGFLRCPMMN